MGRGQEQEGFGGSVGFVGLLEEKMGGVGRAPASGEQVICDDGVGKPPAISPKGMNTIMVIRVGGGVPIGGGTKVIIEIPL